MKYFFSIIFSLLVFCYHGISDSDCKDITYQHRMHQPPTIQSKHLRSKRATSQRLEWMPCFWNGLAQKALRQKIENKINKNVAKNLILFVGDGMSVTTTTSARIYEGQKFGFSGEERSLSFDEFPYVALSKTYCVDQQTADSACSATAYFAGIKTNSATIGVCSKVQYNDCRTSLLEANRVSSIMKWAQTANKATGIVTTTRITHASPAGAYAHTANRDWECDTDMLGFSGATNCMDIAKQLIRGDTGKNLNVIFGGGRRKFLPLDFVDSFGTTGERNDSLNLINEWSSTRSLPRSQVIYTHSQLQALNYTAVHQVLGLFTSDHFAYNRSSAPEQPSLTEMTVSAIRLMTKNTKGFVLFVEGGRIDHAHHSNLAKQALIETVEFSDAVRAAMSITSEKDTLIVVTADHSHTMTMSGYSKRGEDILGRNTEISDIDNFPYMTLSYANGPSGGHARYNITEQEILLSTYVYPSMVPLKSETHGGDDVAIYARGPYAHLFTGVLEQHTIPHFMAYASCIGHGNTACKKIKP